MYVSDMGGGGGVLVCGLTCHFLQLSLFLCKGISLGVRNLKELANGGSGANSEVCRIQYRAYRFKYRKFRQHVRYSDL